MIATWPQADGGEEYTVAFDRAREMRLLVIPPLFDEANKTRHLLVETMRRLDKAGIDSFLPDLPGWNESLDPLDRQTIANWKLAAQAATDYFRTNHVLAVRAGGVLAPRGMPGWRYAPVSGASILRALLRGRVISANEAGRNENSESLLLQGRTNGLELAGYKLSDTMICELEAAQIEDNASLADIAQSAIGGAAPWLRAEPGFDAAQADALSAIIATGLS